MFRPALLALAALAASASLAAAEENYLDDRSTPVDVVRSYYNALDRGEYARAYTYRIRLSDPGDTAALQTAYGRFRDGLADMAHIRLRTGAAFADGSAGAIHYYVPAVIDSADKTGTHRLYAGCYHILATEAAIQDTVPFDPLFIAGEKLRPADGDFGEIPLPDCSF